MARYWMALGLALWVAGCGGGNGLGPGEARKREDKVKDTLPVAWSHYQSGNYQAAIDAFTQTLDKADQLESVDGTRNQIKAEAQNGIGWAFFRMQNLDDALSSFRQATQLDRRTVDAWVGWAGVALAQRRYGEAIQYASQALEIDPNYSTADRQDEQSRNLSHDQYDQRHVRLLLAASYFQLGRYSAQDRPDPNNAAAQLQRVAAGFRFRDPGQLLEGIALQARLLQEGNSEP